MSTSVSSAERAFLEGLRTALLTPFEKHPRLETIDGVTFTAILVTGYIDDNGQPVEVATPSIIPAGTAALRSILIGWEVTRAALPLLEAVLPLAKVKR